MARRVGRAGGRLLLFLRGFAPVRDDGIAQLVQPAPMRRRDGKDAREAEPRKFAVEVRLLFAVDLVRRDENRALTFAQKTRHGLVQRREPLPRIDHENDFRGRGQRKVDFAGDGVAEAFAVLHADAARVDQRQPVLVPARRRHHPVARRAGPVEDERNIAARPGS